MILHVAEYGAISQGILASLASTFLITTDTWKFIDAAAAPYSAFLGCLIALLGFGVFVLCGQHSDEQQAQYDLLVSVNLSFRDIGILLVDV